MQHNLTKKGPQEEFRYPLNPVHSASSFSDEETIGDSGKDWELTGAEAVESWSRAGAVTLLPVSH